MGEISSYLKNLYLYNYIRTFNKVKKMYNDKDLHTYYATYLMAGKITFPFIYPLFKFKIFLFHKTGLYINSKILFIILGILIFGLNYFFVEKKIVSLIIEFKKVRTEYDYFLHTIILMLILIFFNLILAFSF